MVNEYSFVSLALSSLMNASMNETLKNETIFQDLTHHKKEGDSVKSKIELVENLALREEL
ncbi:hypothetical protein Glove_212g188 [Diversispora epigaea]|uniref:Uncharacterized protein n=1 Tax=Diversispora epigaea TaxID=1348612 RepID=A0A397IHW0_9GLOM|nr:hypothetical protein Glove_212g188 [Diversispora epigaea]